MWSLARTGELIIKMLNCTAQSIETSVITTRVHVG